MNRTMMSRWLSDMLISRCVLGAIILAGMLTLGAARGSDLFFDLAACDLSLYQRGPYAVAAIVSAYAVADSLPERASGLIIGLCASLFALAAIAASYHVGLQEGWWSDIGLCGPDPSSLSAEEQLRAALRQDPVRAPASSSPGASLGCRSRGSI
jgi:disulfide bond formation protein DsbB